MPMNDLSGYQRHIDACNPVVEETFVPWSVAGKVVGWLRPALAERIQQDEDLFEEQDGGLSMCASLNTFEARSDALHRLAQRLAEEGNIGPLMGELYPVTPDARAEAVCAIDRSAGAYFGIRAFGQHLNAYVRRGSEIWMWIGRRAMDRLVFPGHLDNMVAGGLPYQASLQENLLKEAWEEAALPAVLARKSRSVSVVTYNRVAKRGYRPDVLYCYDLELSEGFQPQNTDGEVEEFMLLPIEEVARLVRETDEFKLNCNLVIIDFLIRHGYIEPHHPGYLELSLGLRRPLAAPSARL